MLFLTEDEKDRIDYCYRNFLFNLKHFLENGSLKNELDCVRIIINMLKNGQFSINKSIVYDDQFKYLALPNLNNDGSYVMYGICCCRHASVFLDDVLKILGFDSSLLYIFIDENNCWQVAEPFCANHLVVLLKVNDYEYLLDPIHSFILKKEKDQTLTKLDCDTLELIENYQDSNIDTIGRILKKYYDLDRLGIDYLYDYRY